MMITDTNPEVQHANGTQMNCTTSPERGGELTAARMAEIRTRILEGAYNSLEVADQVARRMLERGDV